MSNRIPPPVRAELRRIRQAFPQLLDDAAAGNVMLRLARQRCRHAELSVIVEADGGASEKNLELVAEARQCSRSASSLEQQLRSWWIGRTPPQSDALHLMGLARKAILARAAAGAIEHEPEPESNPTKQPFSAVALLRDLREQDEDA